MKKLIRILLVVLALAPALLHAHEGMWLVSLLNKVKEAEMKGLGLNLTAQEIYDINNASLKDAIVRLNGGQCTGEVVSDKALIFTNHHCSYDAIQSLSTVQNDMLTNGFCAKSLSEELPIPGFEISFLVRIEDVTKAVLAGVTDDMTEAQRKEMVTKNSAEIRKNAQEGNKYDIEVKSFFYDNEYYLFVYNTFTDVRLVGNPPESVGKYGGDTDNWMWPRHTGDFSMLRIYADKSNNAADYSAENVPYKPKHFLPVTLDGVKEGDFSMIMGYPGSTDRFLSSWGVKQALELSNPSTIEIRDLKLKTQKSHMDADPKVRLQYAAKYAGTANYWKYFIGQDKGLLRLDVLGKKQAQEAEFSNWVSKGNDARKKKYGDALNQIKDYYAATDANAKANVYCLEAGLIGADITLFAFRFNRTCEAAMKETDPAKQKEILTNFKGMAEEFYKDFDASTDRDVFANLSELYKKNIAEAQRPTWMQTVDKKFKGNMRMFTDKMYASTILADKGKLYAFIESASTKSMMKLLEKDMAIMVAKSTYEVYKASFNNPAQEKFDVGYRKLVAGMREMNSDKVYAPDANSTMRLTYGLVGDYYPADGVHYDYYTTSKGILEKRDDSNPEFVVPEKLAELLKKKDFGRYANEKGELVTCFIGNTDITGGNSGSPVIDGDGNLIGIAFDGNWEAMSGDIAFEPELQRTIAVDIRYVLFTIDKLMGGKNIIDELKFEKRKPKFVPAPPAPPVAPVEEVAPAGTGVKPGPGNGTGSGVKPLSKAELEKKAAEEKKKKEAEMAKMKEDAKKKGEDAKKKAEQEAKKKAEDLKKNVQDGKKTPPPAPAPKPAAGGVKK
jgi:Peptidase S46